MSHANDRHGVPVAVAVAVAAARRLHDSRYGKGAGLRRDRPLVACETRPLNRNGAAKKTSRPRSSVARERHAIRRRVRVARASRPPMAAISPIGRNHSKRPEPSDGDAAPVLVGGGVGAAVGVGAGVGAATVMRAAVLAQLPSG